MVHIAVEMAPICKVSSLPCPHCNQLSRGRLAGSHDRQPCASADSPVHRSVCPTIECCCPMPENLNSTLLPLLPPPSPQVGGLGDVVTSLGRAVQEQGHQTEVILPR